MAVDAKLSDGGGKGYKACVTPRGQLVTSPLSYSSPYNATAGVINTAYNLVTPKPDQRFVITDIIIYANKNVGVNDATVDLYEATAIDSTTITKSIIQIEMVQKTTLTLTGLNMIVTEGRWVNIKTDDDDIFCTLMGYYVNA